MKSITRPLTGTLLKCVVCSEFKDESLFVYRGDGRRIGFTCRACASTRSKLWAKNNRERANAIASAWRKNNPEKCSAAQKKYNTDNPKRWRKDNPEKRAATSARWRERNPGWWRKYIDLQDSRERTRRWKARNPNKWRERYDRKMSENPRYATEQSQRWARNNPGKALALAHAYRLRRMHRIPRWADLKKIEEIYKLCPKGHQVDHVIPLCGKLVSGLHVPENLQYLTPLENIKKFNHYSPDA